MKLNACRPRAELAAVALQLPDGQPVELYAPTIAQLGEGIDGYVRLRCEANQPHAIVIRRNAMDGKVDTWLATVTLGHGCQTCRNRQEALKDLNSFAKLRDHACKVFQRLDDEAKAAAAPKVAVEQVH